MALEAMDVCLRMIKESKVGSTAVYSQEQCIDYIPYCLSGLSCAHFFDNLSRNSCISPSICANRLIFGKGANLVLSVYAKQSI